MIRIISGSNKGRKIIAPQNLPARPTTDFAKQALFNILENDWDLSEVRFLDLFAGTGNISYEMASRGCKNIMAIDNDFHCVEFIKKTALNLKMDGIHAIKKEVLSFLNQPSNETFDLIFADPPYTYDAYPTLIEKILNGNYLNQDGVFILEHSAAHKFNSNPCILEHRNYGKVNFSFFKRGEKKD